MNAETIDVSGVEITRDEPREYRKVATVRAGPALRGGVMPTLEGDHSYEAGDYICGPGAGGEFWPVKRAIFEATYQAATPSPAIPEAGLDRAWAEAEAALPEGWEFIEVKRYHGLDRDRVFARARLSSVLDDHGLLGGNEQSVWADTPQAALRALTERLRMEPAAKGARE